MAIRFTISDEQSLEKIRGWIKSGRGVALWKTQDLSCMSRPDMITPGDGAKPHWAYAKCEEPLKLEEIEVGSEV
jgi:hypothetical protein